MDLGKLLIEKAHKIFIDCSQKFIKVCEKCGFKQKEIQMVQYLDD